MPKMKTKSSMKKRVKVTAGGIKRGAAQKRHRLYQKSKSMKTSARKGLYVHESDVKMVSRFLPYDA